MMTHLLLEEAEAEAEADLAETEAHLAEGDRTALASAPTTARAATR